MKLLNKSTEIGSTLKAIWLSSRRHGVDFLPALKTAIRLYSAENFSLREIVGYELFRAEVARSMPVMISKHESLDRMAKINPRSLEERAENKSLFYQECQSAGLPIPEHYGIFQKGKGFDANHDPISSPDEWIKYFRMQLPEHFIVKDVQGVYGSGFQAFSRTKTGFKISNGVDASVEGLYSLLEKNSTAGLLIQERLFNHPDLTLCSDNASLSTLRINTFLEENGAVTLLFYIMKIPVGNNITDNFAMGRSGNLIAFGDPDDGILRGARVLHPSGVGLTTVTKHPVSNHDINGFTIPMWKEAVELAERAHREVFSEFGTLGWDLALTSRGPVLLEANPWWDPPMYAPQVMSNKDWQRIFG